MRRKKEPVPDWRRRANWEAMRSQLCNVNWRDSLDGKMMDSEWRELTGIVAKLAEKHVPRRRKRNRNKPAWMTRKILRAVRKKKRMWKAVRNSRITDEYKQVEKEVKT